MPEIRMIEFTTEDGKKDYFACVPFEWVTVNNLKNGVVLAGGAYSTFMKFFKKYIGKTLFMNDGTKVTVEVSSVNIFAIIVTFDNGVPLYKTSISVPTYSLDNTNTRYDADVMLYYNGDKIYSGECPYLNKISKTWSFKSGFLPYSGESDDTHSVRGTEYWFQLNAPFFKESSNNFKDREVYPGKPSGPNFGSGNFDDTSDNIEVPDLPYQGAADTGMIALYEINITNLKLLGGYLWSKDFIDTIIKNYNSQMDCIISLKMYRVQPPSGTNKAIKIGNADTPASGNKLSTQFVKLDCGDLFVNEYYGGALDYSPYTKVSIFLPMVGVVPLSTEEVMNATLNVTYSIDMLTGGFICFIKVSRDDIQSVLYSFTGTCSADIPLSGSNMAQVYGSLIRGAATLGGALATGGASIAAGASADVVGASQLTSLLSNAANVAGSKPNVEHGGSMVGNVGIMGILTPYLIIERPKQSIPNTFGKHYGFPANISAKLSELNGFTAVESVHVEVNCTEGEAMLIEETLKQGIIL